MDGYISKPVRAHELSRTIAEFSSSDSAESCCDVLERDTALPVSNTEVPGPRPAAVEANGRKSAVENGKLVDWTAALKSVGGDRELLLSVVGAALEEWPMLVGQLNSASRVTTKSPCAASCTRLKALSARLAPRRRANWPSGWKRPIVAKSCRRPRLPSCCEPSKRSRQSCRHLAAIPSACDSPRVIRNGAISPAGPPLASTDRSPSYASRTQSAIFVGLRRIFQLDRDRPVDAQGLDLPQIGQEIRRRRGPAADRRAPCRRNRRCGRGSLCP